MLYWILCQCPVFYVETEIFLELFFYRTPLVSFLYERGWRQNFIWGGFPGPEKEVRQKKPISIFKGLFFGGNYLSGNASNF